VVKKSFLTGFVTGGLLMAIAIRLAVKHQKEDAAQQRADDERVKVILLPDKIWL
jgi:hypothetical protein